MFSSPPTLKKLLMMTKEESDHLNRIIQVFETHGIKSPEMYLEIIQLRSINLYTLYKFSVKNAFIKEILINNKDLNTEWKNKLIRYGLPHTEFVSADKKVTVSLFSQLMGALLMSELKKCRDKRSQEALEVLNKACEFNIYNALIQRLNFYVDYIIELLPKSHNRETIDTYIQFIIRDITKMCNIYGAIAHLDSAFVLFRLAENILKQEEQQKITNYFFIPAATNKFSWVDKYDSSDCPLPVILFASAIEHLYMAKILEDEPFSKNVRDQLIEGRSILDDFKDSYADAEDLEKKIKAKLGQLNIPLVDSFCRMSLEAAQNLSHKK